MFKQLHINITLTDALILMPKYQKMLKALLSNKEKLQELANTPLNENCSAVILKKLPKKLGDPGKFLILCGFNELKCKALADLGSNINLMPLSVWKKLGLPELISTRMTLKLANRAICDESFHEACDRYKDLLRACPHHGFTELYQLDTFYNVLNSTDQDSLNSAAGGNLLERRTQDVLTIIENKSKNMMASFFQMNTASTSGSGPLPSNTIANPKGKLKSITTRSGLVLDEPFVPMPPPFISPEEDELVILKKLPEKLRDPGKFLISCGVSELKCKALADLGASINLMPLLTTRALIDVHGEEMILRNDDKRLTLNMRHDTSSYLNQPQKESINMINIYNDSYEDYLEDLFAINHLSGNLTFSSHTDLTSPKVINPLSNSTTTSSLDHLLEEFADELALITFPLGNDDLPFDIESDLREIEYLLNHDPTKEMDSILKDLIDENTLADPNENPFDTIPEMFTDEHGLDYSSPSLYDDYDDDLFEFESDNDDAYNDPLDFNEDKIKESKLLIDEIDLPRSSDFLPSPEYDSFLFEDFSKVDALPSTDNEDRVFNPGILIHENLFEVIVQVTPDKNVKKISSSNASLILEDFNPPLYELLFHKEVPGSETLLSFLSKNKEKISTPRFSLLKEFILLFSQNYLIGALKLSRSLKKIKARWRFFLAHMERTSVFWMFRVSISIPYE
uniref:Reverse transcriptase domain-containing protein n=1 Tax=Tanacetum cinerariifolium TaxID=118510 RepID=A0A6L2MWN6_TANCI|nr:reverse transcriptase domain-containing protein [Tanacetum cinerariifolium]